MPFHPSQRSPIRLLPERAKRSDTASDNVASDADASDISEISFSPAHADIPQKGTAGTICQITIRITVTHAIACFLLCFTNHSPYSITNFCFITNAGLTPVVPVIEHSSSLSPSCSASGAIGSGWRLPLTRSTI